MMSPGAVLPPPHHLPSNTTEINMKTHNTFHICVLWGGVSMKAEAGMAIHSQLGGHKMHSRPSNYFETSWLSMRCHTVTEKSLYTYS